MYLIVYSAHIKRRINAMRVEYSKISIICHYYRKIIEILKNNMLNRNSLTKLLKLKFKLSLDSTVM